MFDLNSFGRRILVLSVAGLIGACISGCATTGTGSSTGQLTGGVNAEFMHGGARLTCGLGCSMSDGASRQKYRRLYQQGMWAELATEVLRVGYEIDRNYFYLGRAAEGLGQNDSARVYYRLAMSATHRCGGSINVCDGLSVPSEIKARYSAMDQQAAAVAAKQAADRKAAEQAAANQRAAEQARKATAAQAARRASATEPAFGSGPVHAVPEPRPAVRAGSDAVETAPATTPKKAPVENVRSLTDL